MKPSRNKGRAAGETPTVVIRTILDIAPASFFPTLSSCRYMCEHTVDDIALCPMCSSILERPVELQCCKLVCAECLVKNIQQSGELSCPCCSDHPLTSGYIRAPSGFIMKVLGTLMVSCGTCARMVKACNFTTHLESKCTALCELPDSPSKTAISQILSKFSDSTPSPSECRVAGSVIKRMISSSDGIVLVPTGSHGQV